MTPAEQRLKRGFDLIVAGVGILLVAPVIMAAWLVAALETRSNGFFLQTRIGKHGKPFRVIKIRTMIPAASEGLTVTTATDRRITRSGRWMRRFKIDELPQLINILRGEMSFVGPRPDVPGYADRLEGEDRIILSVRPGITGPASLKYRDEEAILARVRDPKRYNDEVIWPDKVAINKAYIREWSFWKDIHYLVQTLTGASE